MASPKVDWMIMTERFEIKDGKANLYHVLPGFWSSRFPFIVPEIHFVARVVGAPGGKHQITLLQDATLPGRLIFTPLNIELDNGGVALIEFEVKQLHVNVPGTYTYALVADGSVIGHVSLHIEKR